MSDHTGSDVPPAIDALAPGETYLLTTDGDAKALLQRLQAERPRQFDWHVLEVGPATYRVAITRRTTDRHRTVSDYLSRDHDRLDALLIEVSRLAAAGAFQDAARGFADFTCGLSWHIDAEEHTLFPTFEAKTGILEGPTRVLREEHRLIRLRMAEVSAALAAADETAAAPAIAALNAILDEHNLKEEQVLYPMTDRAMTDTAERDDLVNQIEIT